MQFLGGEGVPHLKEVLHEVTKAWYEVLRWPPILSLMVLWIATIETLFHADTVADLLVSYT